MTMVSALALIGIAAAPAFGQFPGYGGFGGGAVTVQGDILRGEGFFLQGAGQYNYYTAMAESINVDTMIRLNDYIYYSIKIDNAEKGRRRAAQQKMRLENYSKIRDRIANNPNQTDMMKGDALNELFDQLAGPKFAPSSYRLNSFKLDAGLIRKIPFFYAPQQATIAMSRLNSWPIALRGPDFARERRKYERDLDKVLELELEQKTTREPLLALGASVKDLAYRLDEVIPPENDTLYKEAKTYIKELASAQEMMKSKDIEKIIGEIDRYSGTTVHDLVDFMRAFKLRFAVPKIGDERRAYPKIYAALKEQLVELNDAAARDGQAPDPAPEK
jgi:hypothetical protein